MLLAESLSQARKQEPNLQGTRAATAVVVCRAQTRFSTLVQLYTTRNAILVSNTRYDQEHRTAALVRVQDFGRLRRDGHLTAFKGL